ncbi:MAG: PD-(D/E)XK nuclease family protein [Oscillospiraceae bacterium]|nr:PD-(D/E)XK nuclease family protein [Oscillospiraceae bacterium]
MIYRIFGRSGYGKSEYLYELMQGVITAHPDRQFDIFLIVPEQETVNTERRIIDRFGNTANLRIEVLNFPRLAGRTARKVGRILHDYADSTVKKLAMSQAIRLLEPALEHYGKVALNMEFVEKITETVDRLKTELIVPAALEGAALELYKKDTKNPELIKKINEIGMIYAAYEKLLRESGSLRDISDEMSYLCSLLDLEFSDSAGTIKKFFNGTDVFIDSFDAFSNGHKQVLSRIFSQADNVYITHKHSPAFSGGEENNIFYKVSAASEFTAELAREKNLELHDTVLDEPKRFKNEILSHLEKNIWTGEKFGGIQPAKDILEIFECAKIFDEAETAAKKILYLVREKNYRYSDIQIIAASADDYRGVLDTVFEKYGIPLFMSVRTGLSSKPLMSMLLSLFDMIIYDFRLENIHGYIKNGLCGLSYSEIDELDIYITAWQIQGLRRYAGRDWNMHPDGYVEYEEADQNIKNALESLNAVRRKFIAPVNRFKKKTEKLAESGENTIKNITTAIVDFLEDINAYERLMELCGEQRQAGDLSEAAETVQIWNILMELLQKIVLVCGNDQSDLKSYAELFRFILNDADIGKIPTSLDEVVVLSADLLKSGEKKCAVVMGVNTDIFPPKIIGRDLFDDREKTLLKSVKLDFIQDCTRESYDWLYYFYNAVSCASECLILTYRQAELTGELLLPSVGIDRIMSLFPDLKIYKQDENMNFYNFDSEYENMFFNLEGIKNGEIEAGINSIGDKILNAALKNYFNTDSKASAEKSTGFKDSIIDVNPELADELFYNLKMSSSKLESYVNCPFSYFCRYVLELKPDSSPKMQLHDIGRFIHKILELFMLEVRDKELDFKNITDEYIKAGCGKITDEYLSSVIKDYEFKTARFIYLLNRLKKIVFEIVKNLRDEFKTCDFIPADFELSISGRSDGVPPIEIDIPGKGTLTVTGIIDRVDILKRNGNVYIRIADYKTGSRKFNISDVLLGLNLQMFIYLFSIWRNAGARYDSVGREGEGADEKIPAGVIYMPSRLDKYEKTPDMNDEDAENERAGKFIRSGLFLRDENILRAMEHNLEGRYIPIKLKEGAVFRSNASGVLASLEQIGKLERHIVRILTQIAAELSGGSARIQPFKTPGRADSCRYCDMGRVCRFEEVDANKKDAPSFAPDKVWEILEE